MDESGVAYQRTSWLIKIGFWLALVFASYMAFAAPQDIPSFRISDVILHAVTFSVLTYGLRMAYFPDSSPHQIFFPKTELAASGWMLLYGVAIEIGQGFTPQRIPEMRDLWIDGLGIVVGLLGYRLVGPWSLALARRLFN